MFDSALIAVTAVLASSAAVMNITAAVQGNQFRRGVCAMRGLLATIYAVAYVWLLFHPARRLEWSRAMTGVSVTAWLLVWVYPAWQTLRLAHPTTPDDIQ